MLKHISLKNWIIGCLFAVGMIIASCDDEENLT